LLPVHLRLKKNNLLPFIGDNTGLSFAMLLVSDVNLDCRD